MKTNDELNALKEDIETVNKKPAKLNEAELKQAVGGRWQGQGKPTVIQSKCDGCEVCVDGCPAMFIHYIDGVIYIDDDCPACGQCVNTCPAQALVW